MRAPGYGDDLLPHWIYGVGVGVGVNVAVAVAVGVEVAVGVGVNVAVGVGVRNVRIYGTSVPSGCLKARKDGTLPLASRMFVLVYVVSVPAE